MKSLNHLFLAFTVSLCFRMPVASAADIYGEDEVEILDPGEIIAGQVKKLATAVKGGKADEVAFGLHTIDLMLASPKSITEAGTTAYPEIKPEAIKEAVAKALEGKLHGDTSRLNTEAASIYAHLAAQQTTSDKTRRALEDGAFALFDKVDSSAQRGILRAIGDLGSVGKLSPSGEKKLIAAYNKYNDGKPGHGVALVQVIRAMAQIRPKSETIRDLMIRLAQAKIKSMYRDAALEGLEDGTSPKITKALLDILGDKNESPSIREVAFDSLMGGKKGGRPFAYRRPKAIQNAAIRKVVNDVVTKENDPGTDWLRSKLETMLRDKSDGPAHAGRGKSGPSSSMITH